MAQLNTSGSLTPELVASMAAVDSANLAWLKPLLLACGWPSRQSLALLTDRVAKARGQPQVYGTQTTVRDRKAIVDPIVDSAGVDARRAQLGLPPLAVYKGFVDSMLSHAGAP